MIMSLDHFFQKDTKHEPTNIWFLGEDQSCRWMGFYGTWKAPFSIRKQVFPHPHRQSKECNGRIVDPSPPTGIKYKMAYLSG